MSVFIIPFGTLGGCTPPGECLSRHVLAQFVVRDAANLPVRA